MKILLLPNDIVTPMPTAGAPNWLMGDLEATRMSEVWHEPRAFTYLDPNQSFQNVIKRFKKNELFPMVAPETSGYIDDLVHFQKSLSQLESELPTSAKTWNGLDPTNHTALLNRAKQVYREAVRVFDQYSIIATDNWTSSLAGEEALGKLIKHALQHGEPLPFSASFALPLSAWNKRFGHAVATMLKTAAFRALQNACPSHEGQVSIARGTHVGLQIPGNRFDAQHLNDILRNLPDLIMDELRNTYLSESAENQDTALIQMSGDRLQLLNDKGEWIDSSEISRRITLGVQQAGKPVLTKNVHHEESRQLIALTARDARNMAITRTERLVESYEADSCHSEVGIEPIAVKTFEFAQGVLPEPEEIRAAFAVMSQNDPSLIAAVLDEIGISRAGDDWKTETETDTPIFLKIQAALGQPVGPALGLFALKSGWLPRPLHDLEGFLRLDGPLHQFIKAITLFIDTMECGGTPEWEIIGLRLLNALPEWKRLHQKAERALYESNDHSAIKKDFFKRMALRFMQANTQSHRFHTLAFDIDHLRDFFTAHPLSPRQLSDRDMLRILRLAEHALKAYAASLGVSDVGFCRTRDGGDEIFFIFPETVLNEAGHPVTLRLYSEDADQESFDTFLRRELAKEFSNNRFPYTDKLLVGQSFDRLPKFRLTFADGTTVIALRKDVGSAAAEKPAYFIRQQSENGVAWSELSAQRKDEPVRIERVHGTVGFTVAVSTYEFDPDLRASDVINVLDEFFASLLDKTDGMKNNGIRGRTDFFEPDTLVSALSYVTLQPPLTYSDGATDLPWLLYANFESKYLTFVFDPQPQ